MISEMKWVSLVIGNCVLIFLVQLVNDALAPYTIHFFPFALFIFAPLILLPFGAGLASVIATGLILDATNMLAPGVITIILVVVYTSCFWFRQQFKTYFGWHSVLILQSSNAIIVAFLSVFINPSNYANFSYWGSILFNLFFSQVLLVVIASWFLDLQNSLSNLFGSKFQEVDGQNQVENFTGENS